MRRVLLVTCAATALCCVVRREVTCEFTAAPGKQYTVLLSTFNPKEERSFVLRVMSSKPIEFKKMS